MLSPVWSCVRIRRTYSLLYASIRPRWHWVIHSGTVWIFDGGRSSGKHHQTIPHYSAKFHLHILTYHNWDSQANLLQVPLTFWLLNWIIGLKSGSSSFHNASRQVFSFLFALGSVVIDNRSYSRTAIMPNPCDTCMSSGRSLSYQQTMRETSNVGDAQGDRTPLATQCTLSSLYLDSS